MGNSAVNKRNVVLLGQSGCGKTTIVEAMAFASGVTNRLGHVPEGNTISDYDKEEINRGFSVNMALLPLKWEGVDINIIDTPGNSDFIGEVECALNAADGAVIVVNGKNGVEPGTIKAWELCEKYNLPRLVFVTAMDDDNASYKNVINDLTDRYGKRIAPFHQPLRENQRFVGYVNIVKMNARRFTGIAKYEETDIPDYSVENLSLYREKLLDAVAEVNDELMDKYFAGEEFTLEEIEGALHQNVASGNLVPVTMGSGLNVHGVFMLLNDIARYFGDPEVEPDKAFAAKVFKTISDPFIGKYSLIKVVSGSLKNDSTIYNPRTDASVKLSRLYKLTGKEQAEVSELVAGDIGAIPKLVTTRTGDTLCTKEAPVNIPQEGYSVPYTFMAYDVNKGGDEDRLSAAVSKLLEEDVTLRVFNDTANSQQLIYGIGEQHLEVSASKLLTKYRVEVKLSKPKIAYKETITKMAASQGRYKKQSGGHGQFGDVKMEFEPLNNYDVPYEFYEKVFGGAVPKNYFPAVEKGIEESTKSGPLAGYPVVGIKATLVDGSYHPVDSSEMAFKSAAILAFKEAYAKANPVLLEPIVKLSVTVPDKFMGDILGDINKRRGRVLEYNPVDNYQVISALVPMAELLDYSTKLKAITGGYASYSYEPYSYEIVTEDIKRKILE